MAYSNKKLQISLLIVIFVNNPCLTFPGMQSLICNLRYMDYYTYKKSSICQPNFSVLYPEVELANNSF